MASPAVGEVRSVVAEGGRQLWTPHAGAGDEPLISVITAVFNGGATLERTIRSVLAQGSRNFEYIVIDGGSTDSTLAILERLNDHVAYWRSEPDSGIYDAWNKGIMFSRGQWIAFLGAGDEFLPNALEQYTRLLSTQEHSGLQYVSSRVELMSGGRRLGGIGKAWRWPEFSRYMTVAHVGSMHHRSLFKRYGLFDPSYKICGDYELLLRPRAALRAAFIPAFTAIMAYGGISNLRPQEALRESLRAKLVSGGRPRWLCSMEFYYARVRAIVRRLVHRWRK